MAVNSHESEHSQESSRNFELSRKIKDRLSGKSKFSRVVQATLPALLSMNMAHEAKAANLIPTPTRTPTPTIETVIPTATMTPEMPSIEIANTTAETLNVRSGPGTTSEVVATLPKGSKVTIVSTENGWAKIIFTNSETGKEVAGEYYVSEDFLDNRQFAAPATPTPRATEAPTSVLPTVTPTVEATSEISETEMVTRTEVIDANAIGGNVEDEKLLGSAIEVLGREDVALMSLAHQQPLATNQDSEVTAIFENGQWNLFQLPEDLKATSTSANLEEVKNIIPEAVEAKFSAGTIYVYGKDTSKELATIKDGEVILSTEYQLLQLLKGTPEFQQHLTLDSVIVKTVHDTLIAEVDGYWFIYAQGKWQLSDSNIQALLEQSQYVASEEEIDSLVINNEIAVVLQEGADLEGKVTLHENAEQVILQLLAEAFTESEVLSPIMGTTVEEVLANLRKNNYSLPPEFQVPIQLNDNQRDRLLFIPAERASVKTIKLELFWNDQVDLSSAKHVIWSGSPGMDGVGVSISDEGNLVLTGVIKRRPLYTEDPEKLLVTIPRRLSMGLQMYERFDGDIYAGGDELGMIEAFNQANSVPDAYYKEFYKIVNLVE